MFTLPANTVLAAPETLSFIYQGSDELGNASDRILALNASQAHQNERLALFALLPTLCALRPSTCALRPSPRACTHFSEARPSPFFTPSLLETGLARGEIVFEKITMKTGAWPIITIPTCRSWTSKAPRRPPGSTSIWPPIRRPLRWGKNAISP